MSRFNLTFSYLTKEMSTMATRMKIESMIDKAINNWLKELYMFGFERMIMLKKYNSKNTSLRRAHFESDRNHKKPNFPCTLILERGNLSPHEVV